MELLIPSLVALLVAIAIAYFILPMLAPSILIGGSAVLLAVAVYLHYKQFGVVEYERSTWQNNLKAAGSWVMLGAVLLGAYGFYAMNNGGSDGGGMVAPALATEMPPLSLPQAGGGFKNVFNTAAGRINSLMRHGRI
jgi:uncharacterized membrane protein